MKNEVDFTPYENVRLTKVIVIIIGVLSAIAGVYFLFEEETDTGFMLIGSAISMLLLGGIIGGLSEMVKAACIHNWEFDQKMRQIELGKIADEEVEPFADFQEE